MPDEPINKTVSTSSQPKAPAPNPDRALHAELARLEAKRAELKKTKKDDLDPDEFAKVKGRLAELKAQLGEG